MFSNLVPLHEVSVIRGIPSQEDIPKKWIPMICQSDKLIEITLMLRMSDSDEFWLKHSQTQVCRSKSTSQVNSEGSIGSKVKSWVLSHFSSTGATAKESKNIGICIYPQLNTSVQ